MKAVMKTLARGVAVALAVATSFSAFAQVQSEYDKHREAATRNAGSDEFLLNTWRFYYCMYPENRQADRQAVIGDRTPVPLTRVFDDVWYVGDHYIGQYIFKSSSAFLLLDTMFNSTDAQTKTIPALNALGLSPSLPVGGLYLTHGHGDHDGGAFYLQQQFGMPIVMGSADAGGKQYTATPVDSGNPNPVAVTLAGRQLTLLSTPGHTNGSLTAFIPVHDGGRELQAVVVGGSAMPTTISGSRNYLDGVERTYALAKVMNAEASFHPHPVFDGSKRNLNDINANGLSSPSQFAIGNERILRGLAILRQCSAANVARVDSTALVPVWRVTSIDFAPSPENISAKVSSDWGPVPFQQVTFTSESTGAQCVATTDEQGVARCNGNLHPLRPFKDKVTATFAGAQSPAYVDLGSTKTATVQPAGFVRKQ